jgi:hypothetical protein
MWSTLRFKEEITSAGIASSGTSGISGLLPALQAGVLGVSLDNNSLMLIRVDKTFFMEKLCYVLDCKRLLLGHFIPLTLIVLRRSFALLPEM